MGSRPWAFVGSAVLSGVCVFKSGLSTPIRVSLIVVPDKAIVFTKNYSVMVDFSVLVTGGAGYIGSHAALRLLKSSTISNISRFI